MKRALICAEIIVCGALKTINDYIRLNTFNVETSSSAKEKPLRHPNVYGTN